MGSARRSFKSVYELSVSSEVDMTALRSFGVKVWRAGSSEACGSVVKRESRMSNDLIGEHKGVR